MYEYHDQYTRAHERGDVDAQARWARQLTWEVARHAVGEEIVVYPLMEQHLGQKGKQLADHDRQEHTVSSRSISSLRPSDADGGTWVQSVKEKLYQIESMKPGSEEYSTLLAAVMKHLHEHNDSEEQKDLPELEPHLGAEGSSTAAQSFSRTKKFVPTRSVPPPCYLTAL